MKNHKLKVGDIVRVDKFNGNFYPEYGEYLYGAYCQVGENEKENEPILLFHNSSQYLMDSNYLVLVNPKEDIYPYYLKVNNEACEIEIWKRNSEGDKISFSFHYYDEGDFSFHKVKFNAERTCAKLNFKEEI